MRHEGAVLMSFIFSLSFVIPPEGANIFLLVLSLYLFCFYINDCFHSSHFKIHWKYSCLTQGLIPWGVFSCRLYSVCWGPRPTTSGLSNIMNYYSHKSPLRHLTFHGFVWALSCRFVLLIDSVFNVFIRYHMRSQHLCTLYSDQIGVVRISTSSLGLFKYTGSWVESVLEHGLSLLRVLVLIFNAKKERKEGWREGGKEKCFPTALGNTEMNHFYMILFSTCTSTFCSTLMDEGIWGDFFSWPRPIYQCSVKLSL